MRNVSKSIYRIKIATLTLCASLLGFSQATAANLLVNNPDFEAGPGKGWGLFVPGESKDKGCAFSIVETAPHSGKYAGKMTSSDFARYGVNIGDFSATPGQRFRITAWIKAEAGTEIQQGTAGILFRASLVDGKGANLLGGILYFIGVNSKASLQSYKKGITLAEVTAPLPREWSKIETVIEIPSQVNGEPAPIEKVSLQVFGWLTKGAFYIDDASVEQLP